MGIFDAFKRTRPKHRAAAPTHHRPEAGFTIIDVETTGLSADRHRVLELAVVRTDVTGRVLGEWTQRIDPEGPVGATHIHGITAADIVGSPKFGTLIPNLNAWLTGTVLVAHNARFDTGFLRAEYDRAGWDLPHLPTLCTLEASSYYLPWMDRRRLADCCDAARIPLHGAHSALGDARATAALLAFYLHPRHQSHPQPNHHRLLDSAHDIVWPTRPTRPPRERTATDHTRDRITIATTRPKPADLVSLLADFSLVDALDEGAPAGATAYLEHLAEVLEDGEIDDAEARSLDDLATAHGLSEHDRDSAHRALVLALAHLALDDGKVTRTERAELLSVAELLDLDPAAVTATLDRAEAARQHRLSLGLTPLPADWPHGEPLRVGDKIAFTGCDHHLREQLEQRAVTIGLRLMNNVSSKTALLVTDGSFSGTKATAAAAVGCRVVDPTTFTILLDNLQPATTKTRSRVLPTTTEDPTPSPPTPSVDPADVRRWARANGYAIGTRGRLPAELITLYTEHVGTAAAPTITR